MSLLTFLKQNKNSRKIFGKKELEIINKQLEGVSLTQSEKNRLSRDIKKKLDFIEEIIEFKDEFELGKNQNNKQIIEQTKNIILQDKLSKKITAILLFGSFANNTFTKRSDIDICVLFDNITLKEATKFRIRISGEASNKVDVQVFNILPRKIQRSIAKNHKIIYEKTDYDNINFTIKYLKDSDYFLRMKRIFGEESI